MAVIHKNVCSENLCSRFHLPFHKEVLVLMAMKKFKNKQESATASETKITTGKVSTFCVTSIHPHDLCNKLVYVVNQK